MSVISVIGDTVNPLRIGSSRDFTCTSTGSPAPALVWTKSDRVIRGSGGVLRYVTLTGGPNRVCQWPTMHCFLTPMRTQSMMACEILIQYYWKFWFKIAFWE